MPLMTIRGVEFSLEHSVLNLYPCSMPVYNDFSVCVVGAHFGIEVSREDLQIPSRCFVQDSLEMFIEVLFFFFVYRICKSVTLKEGDFPALGVESSY